MEKGVAIATPSDEQAIKMTLGSPISPYQKFGKSRFTEGTIVVPTYTIQAPLTKGETSSSSAKLTVVPEMALSSSIVFILTHKGAWGDAKLQKWVFGLANNIGSVQKEDTTSHVANALTKTFAILGGVAGTVRSSGSFTVTIDRDAYKAGVLKGLTSVNDETVKAIAAKS